jgi:hypothetical protein
MKHAVLALAASFVIAVPARADTAPHTVQAREIYSRIVSFRTAEGHQQTGPMVAYLK